MAHLTTPELRALLEPFAGNKLRGSALRDTSIDISCPRLGVCKANASVRAVDDDGVTTYFDGREELLPWGKIATVTVRNLDADGYLENWREYKHIGERKAA